MRDGLWNVTILLSGGLRMFRFAIAVLAICNLWAQTPDEWPSYGRDSGGARFSPLKQILRDNVAKLQPVWTFHTGEYSRPSDPNKRQRITAFEATPLMIGGILYFSTPGSRVIALDAETGKPVWEYDAQPQNASARLTRQNRGVAWWPGGRIFAGTIDGGLVALDARTGKPCPDFGDNGKVNLRAGIADRWPDAAYSLNSPPAIFKDLVIVGAEVPEGHSRGPSGVVRAFSARTGKLVWRFNTIPQPGEFGHESWVGDEWRDRTGVNVWSMMSVDEKLGLVFLPTGSASYDFWGGDRKGPNLFANSVVALDANTGKRVWHQQLIHHDLWDYDLPAMPMLIRANGTDAVVQLTKTGLVFAFERATGKPIFGMEERPVPQSEVEGEHTSPTQPFPLKPLPLSRQEVKRTDLNRLTPELAKFCEEMFNGAVHRGVFTPWSNRRLSIVMPGTLGGATWSGGSFDPHTNLLFVNVNEMGALGLLKPQAPGTDSPYRRSSADGEYARFATPDLIPCQKPPFGSLVAVDMKNGEIVWKVPLGVIDSLAAKGFPKTGTVSLGGSIATAGGLVFIGGTNDRRFRAFDSSNGKELWVTTLPASAHSTPMTFRGSRTGKQFVVIAAGGGGAFSRSEGADSLIAFALPE